MNKLPISLCIITHNSADRLKQMVEKHSPFVSEVLIAVQDSDDNTHEIASEVATVAFKRRKKGTADPDRDWLFSMASQPWVLYLDDDEYLSERLVKTLPELLKDNIDIYWFKMKNLVDGVDVQEIYKNPSDLEGNDWHPRLFKYGYLNHADAIHTYPKAVDGAKVAFADYHIVHERTLDKLVKSNRARNVIADDNQRAAQENFISAVKRYLEEHSK